MYCRKCGAQMPDDAINCPNCNEVVRRPGQPETPPPPMAAVLQSSDAALKEEAVTTFSGVVPPTSTPPSAAPPTNPPAPPAPQAPQGWQQPDQNQTPPVPSAPQAPQGWQQPDQNQAQPVPPPPQAPQGWQQPDQNQAQPVSSAPQAPQGWQQPDQNQAQPVPSAPQASQGWQQPYQNQMPPVPPAPQAPQGWQQPDQNQAQPVPPAPQNWQQPADSQASPVPPVIPPVDAGQGAQGTGAFQAPQPYASAYAVAPGQPIPSSVQPAGGKGGKKTGMIIGLCAAGVVVIAAVIVVLLLLFGNPKTQLRNALDKTTTDIAAQQAQTAKDLGFSTVLENLADSPIQGRLSTEMLVEDVPAQISMDIRSDYENRRISMDGTIGMAGTNIDITFDVDDNIIAFGMPGYLSGSYGINTETLGQDLAYSPISQMLGLDYLVDERFSINLFDSLPGAAALVDGSTAQQAEDDELDELYKAMWDAATVEKGKKATVTVLDESKDCTVYNATFPRQELSAYLLALVDGFLDGPVFQQSPMLDSLLEQGGYYGYSMQEAADELRYSVQSALNNLTEDMACTAYIADGYLVMAELTLRSGYDVETITLQVGGRNISDGFMFTVGSGGYVEAGILVQGNHVPHNGVFSTYFEIWGEGMNYYYPDEPVLSFELYYNTASTADNFSLIMSMPDEEVYLEVNGTLTVDTAANRISAVFDEVWMETYYETLDFWLDFSIEPFTGSFPTVNPQMLLEMSEDEVYMLIVELMGNVPGLSSGGFF